jgi:hypothetical protein
MISLFLTAEGILTLSFALETDGKAGMAVVLENSSTPINMNTLAQDLKKQGLPAYARPCFLRLTKHIEMTGSSAARFTPYTVSCLRNLQSEKGRFPGRGL